MSYAIIKTGGKQYRVQEGQTLLVERLGEEPGATVQLPTLLVAGEGQDAKFGGDVDGTTVPAEIVEHIRGEKLIIFKFKPKRGYKRKKGHRQELTRIRIGKLA